MLVGTPINVIDNNYSIVVVGDFVLQMAFRRGILSGGDFVQGDFVRFPLGLHWILKNEKHVINSSILRDGSL